MTVDEIARNLPNGFHDSELTRIAADFVARTATLDLELWVGRMDQPLDGGRETYRKAKLELFGLEYFVVEAPHPSRPYAQASPITIDLCDLPASDDLPPLTPGAFASRFFVDEWNSFITVSASDARLSWTDEAYVRVR